MKFIDMAMYDDFVPYQPRCSHAAYQDVTRLRSLIVKCVMHKVGPIRHCPEQAAERVRGETGVRPHDSLSLAERWV